MYIYKELVSKIILKIREKYRCLVAGYESCACLKSKQTDKDIVYVQYIPRTGEFIQATRAGVVLAPVPWLALYFAR